MRITGKTIDERQVRMVVYRKSIRWSHNTQTSMKKIFATTRYMRLGMIGLLIGVGVLLAPRVFAQSFQDQISSIDAQISQYEQEINRLKAEGDTLQNKLSLITAEKNQLQAEIDKNEQHKQQLQLIITANEQKLERQKHTLNKTVAQIYAEGDKPAIVVLAGSKNIGQYVSEQEVRNTVRDQMKDAMDQVKKLKTELARQQKEVEAVIAQQVGQREQIAAKEAEQAQVLAETRGSEAAYGNMVGSLREQRAAAEAALAASLARAAYKDVAPSGYVSAGAVVGHVGSTGMSTGPHLHLEARSGGSIVNPMSYVQTAPVDMPPGWVSQSFWNADPMYISGHHPGVDYAAPTGTPIYAVSSGMMWRGSSESLLGTWAYGNVAIVEMNNGVRLIYAHMSD